MTNAEYHRKYRAEHRKQCRENSRRWRETHPGYYKKYREKRREYMRTHKKQHHLAAYGITLEQHKAMYLSQNGCCAICEEPVEYDKIQVDHDHNTGRVRGLLCRRCNVLIAIFDNHRLWENAISYIERAK